MSKQIEVIRGGFRFNWSPGGAFVAVRPVEGLTTEVPCDMIELPDWVIVSHMKKDTLQAHDVVLAQALLWLDRSTIPSTIP
jgi:reverse gyrase